tara:strand:- start:491 stop:1411 length:921 start_codon:yes stop_codon:yes gene_type:complete
LENITKIPTIIGPTGVGKSSLSFELAKTISGEIINTDKSLFYKLLNIGIDKPTEAKMDLIKHHLIDFLNPKSRFSLLEFLELVNFKINTFEKKGITPILVGGSGQYIMALLENWKVPKVKPDEKYREKLVLLSEEKGKDFLYKKLKKEFPSIAENIDKNNTRRVIRGFEVGRSGFKLEKQQEKREFTKFKVYGLTMDRGLLYKKIDSRIEKMFKNGWVEEVENLISKGLNKKSPSFKSIGYSEVYSFIKEEISFDDAVNQIKKSTRNLIRHQYNWFKLTDNRIRWIDISGKNDNNYALNIILNDLR